MAAFALRLAYANACYLNPDEALHFDTARPNNWVDTFKASLTLAHPPLFILVLHAFLYLGRTELILRLPSLIAGTAALWLAFAWIRRVFGEIAAIAGLGFLALAPAAMSASTEVRQYGLLLFFVCAALYATERMFAELSVGWAVLQGVCLLGALLSNYTSVVVLFSLGLYVLLRSLLDGLPRRVLFTAGGFQLVLAALLGWLYFGHVRHSIPFGSGASMDYLRHYYYTSASETPLRFVWRAFFGTFGYIVGNRRLVLVLPSMALFLLGIAGALAGKTKAPRMMALLIITPFATGFVAAVFQVFPFAGTRHQTYLLPFVAAGVAAALASLPRGWAVALLLLGVPVAPLWARHALPDNNPRVAPKSDISAAIAYVHQMVPQGSPLFVDSDTREVLEYYLARNDPSLDVFRSEEQVEERLGGYRVVVVVAPQIPSLIQDPRLATMDLAVQPETALQQIAESARALGVPEGNPLWAFSIAWKEPALASRLPARGNYTVKEFGSISVVEDRTRPSS